MKHLLSLALAFGALTYSALAAPSKIAKSTATQCPRCKITLTAKADKTHPVAVNVNGKTFYCCAACGKKDANSKATPAAKATAKPSPTTAKKPAKAPDCPKCGMKMVTAKSTLKATPIKVKGVTYYCCTICPRH